MNYELIQPRDESISPVAQVFKNRGMNYSETDIEHYLHTSEIDLYPPEIITNMRRGVEMLMKHIKNNDKIFLQIDDDCDGFTSSALFLNYLNCLFPNYVQTKIYYSVHDGKKHGLLDAAVVPGYVRLAVIPDAGSNEYEIHEALAARGIDVLVIDHHKADRYSDYACVINNQLDDYPTKSLSGVAMVYKFCRFMDDVLDTDYSNNYLDLVALGVTADVMDMRPYETRYLVSCGLENFKNPLIKALYAKTKYSIDKSGGLSPYNLAYYIAPLINATTRVGTKSEKMTLFESMLEFRAYESIPSTKRGCRGQQESRVEQAARNCTNIKNRQTKARDEDVMIMKRRIEELNLLDHKILLLLMDHGTPSIAGLIANQLVAAYHHPTLILFKQENENGEIIWAGSGRNDTLYGLENFRQFLQESPYVIFAQGHNSAFGCAIADKDIKAFIQESDERLKDNEFSPVDKVDFIFDASSLNPLIVLDLGKLNYIWGQEINKPKLVIERVVITPDNFAVMGSKKDTIKITLPTGLTLIKFGSSAEEVAALTPPAAGCVFLTVLGTCNVNNFNNQENPQIMIDTYEIVGRQDYYF